jgi:hypothetical protein
MGKGYSKDTLKVKSKMASNRIKMKLKKKENELNLAKKNIAVLLHNNKTQSARIKVEGIIREENTMQVMEWLEMMCDLVYQRVNLITNEKAPPEDLMETFCSILYCSERIEIPELMEISQQFGAKYGKEWIKNNAENRSGFVARKIVNALSSKPPSMETVQKKLVEIANENEVDWDPEAEEETLQIVELKEEEKVETDPILVNRMVEILSDPQTFDMTDEEKKDMMRKRGCNAAEAAAALHIVTEKLRDGSFGRKQPNAPSLPFYEAGPGTAEAHGPSFADEPLHGPSFPDGPGAGKAIEAPGTPPGAPTGVEKSVGEPEEDGDDYDDLEARFAALRKGL